MIIPHFRNPDKLIFFSLAFLNTFTQSYIPSIKLITYIRYSQLVFANRDSLTLANGISYRNYEKIQILIRYTYLLIDVR